MKINELVELYGLPLTINDTTFLQRVPGRSGLRHMTSYITTRPNPFGPKGELEESISSFANEYDGWKLNLD